MCFNSACVKERVTFIYSSMLLSFFLDDGVNDPFIQIIIAFSYTGTCHYFGVACILNLPMLNNFCAFSYFKIYKTL